MKLALHGTKLAIFLTLLSQLQGCGTVSAVASVAATTVGVAGSAAVATISAASTVASAGASATKAVAETGGKLIDFAAQQAARDEVAKKAAEAALLELPK